MSMIMSQASVKQSANISVMKVAMNNAESSGNMIEELSQASAKTMEISVNPHVGGNIDIKL